MVRPHLHLLLDWLCSVDVAVVAAVAAAAVVVVVVVVASAVAC